MARILKKKFSSLEEALAELPTKTYEHCKRVSEYMEIIFLRACAAEIYPNEKKVQSRLKEENREIARLAGLYHDIGKAMLPEEYQFFNPSFTAEEQALYRAHVDYSIGILDQMFRKETQCNANQEKYFLQAVGFHHEHWDGQGFPNNISGKNTTIFPRMLALADGIDHMLCETHSETPFEDVMAKLAEEGGKSYDPELIKLLPAMKKRLKKVFESNLGYTCIIPDVMPFVKREPKSTIGCWYRPIEKWGGGGTYACEMELRFKVNKTLLTYGEVDSLIKNEPGMRKDLGVYAALAGCDMVRRLDVAEIPMEFVAINFPTGWLNSKGSAKEILLAISDSAIDPKRIGVVLSGGDFSERRTVLKENITKLKEAGCGIIFDRLTIKEVAEALKTEIPQGADASDIAVTAETVPTQETVPDAAEKNRKAAKTPKTPKVEVGVVTLREITELGATVYRMGAADANALESDAFVGAMKELVKSGITLAADDLDREKYTSILLYLQTYLLSGPVRGEYSTSEDFFRSELSFINDLAARAEAQ